MKLLFKRLFSFAMSIMLLLGCFSRMHAEIWDTQDCINFINTKYRLIGLTEDEICFLCLENYLLLYEHLRRIDLNPSMRLPRILYVRINRELKKAKELSKDNKADFITNLSIIKESFMWIWKDIVAKDSVTPLLGGGPALCDPAPCSEYFKRFVRKNYIDNAAIRADSFLTICLQKYLLLDKYIRYLGMIEEGVGADPTLISEYEFGEIREEMSVIEQFGAYDRDEVIAILRTMRDEFLLAVNFNISK